MTHVAESASTFPAAPGSEGQRGHDLSHFVGTPPQPWDVEGFMPVALSFPNEPGQEASSQMPALAQMAPAVLDAFISGFDSRNVETRKLNARILALEQIQSELLDENAELARVVEAAELAELTAEDVWDEEAPSPTSPSVADEANQDTSTEFVSQPLLAPGVVNAFVRGFESRASETGRLNRKIATLEQVKADLLAEIALLASTHDASNRLAIAAPATPTGVVDGGESSNAEATRLNDIITALEQAKSTLLVENSALASALEATRRGEVPTPEIIDDDAFLSNLRSFATDAIQYTSEPKTALDQATPTFLEDFIGGFNPWDPEAGRLNDRIAFLEQANSDLLAKNAALAGCLDASSQIATQSPEILDGATLPSSPPSSALADGLNTSATLCSYPQSAPSALEDLIECVESRDAEIRRLHDEIVALEQTESDLLVQNAALASALETPRFVLGAATEITDAEGLFSNPRSFTNAAIQDTWTQLQSQAQDVPADLDAFLFGFESVDPETRSLNEKIAVLEQAKSELVAENAVHGSALAASQTFVAPARETSDAEGCFSIPQSFANEENHVTSRQSHSEAHVASPVLYEFCEAIDSRSRESRRSASRIAIFEPARANQLFGYVVRARARRASRRKSNLAKLLMALGACLAGLGIHLLGPQFDSRQTGIAVIAIGAGLGLMNFGWYFRPTGN